MPSEVAFFSCFHSFHMRMVSSSSPSVRSIILRSLLLSLSLSLTLTHSHTLSLSTYTTTDPSTHPLSSLLFSVTNTFFETKGPICPPTFTDTFQNTDPFIFFLSHLVHPILLPPQLPTLHIILSLASTQQRTYTLALTHSFNIYLVWPPHIPPCPPSHTCPPRWPSSLKILMN